MDDYTDFYPDRSDGWEKHGDGFVKGEAECECLAKIVSMTCQHISTHRLISPNGQGGYSALVRRLADGLDLRTSLPVARISSSNSSSRTNIRRSVVKCTALEHVPTFCLIYVDST